ncbi:MAG TPA: hypothetical protein VK036_00115 [Wenzhouxiangella sp.]|nr:hypothetical protein [Wenzhouxiangella sp.]
MHKKATDVIRICAAAGLLLLTGLVAAASPFARPGPDAAAIFGVVGQQKGDVHPVTVVAINGREIVPRDTFWVEPGHYTFRVRPAIVNPRGLKAMRGRTRQASDLNIIELDVEAGKTYYLGARTTGEDRSRPYSVEVYRIVDTDH